MGAVVAARCRVDVPAPLLDLQSKAFLHESAAATMPDPVEDLPDAPDGQDN